MAINKQWATADEAVADIAAGSRLAVGGFGVCGIPQVLISALHARGVDDLTVVSNNCGVDDWGLGILLASGQISTMVSSYVGENKEFERRYLTGALTLELVPQGTLAERLRAGGSGIAGFFTRTGVGTQVADGGLPQRYAADGSVAVASAPKQTQDFEVDGVMQTFVLEEAIRTDVALVHALRGDRHGNLVFARAARNFSPVAAMSARQCIAQVEQLVEPGEIDPDDVHLPGVYVHRVVEVGEVEKRIERRTTRPAVSEPNATTQGAAA